MPTSRFAFGRWIRLALAVLALPAPAVAQGFGRNAVQWEHLQFKVLKTEHFDIHYTPEQEISVRHAARMAERWYARLSRILEFEFPDRQPLILYASHPHFEQTTAIGGAPGEGTGGVTEAFKRRIVLPHAAALAETDHVLGHEIVHAFQFAMTGQGRLSSTNAPGALRMPLWFIEGMAEYLSVGPVDPHTAMWVREAARRDKLPTLRQLGSARYFPYRYGQAFWSYLAGRYGDGIFARLLKALGPRTTDALGLLEAELEVKPEQLSKDWHAAVAADVGRAVAGRQEPAAYGRALITERHAGGRLNVAPALSPDGQRLAFLSERDLFAVELFVADTRSGEVTRRLSRASVDPHLDSLQFIASSGAWDRSGTRIAIGAVVKGRAALRVLDARSGRTLHEARFAELGELFTPSFAPDGRRLVFSASAGGLTDLYLYDLETRALGRLTHDAFADLQPAFRPDGRSIAFVSDRFSTRLDTLTYGNYRLALLDLDAGGIRELPGAAAGKNINPQWSPDGESLYFLSDRGGATNLYRLEVASGALYQVTDLAGGISGITPLSPALSAAAAAERVAITVYDDGHHEIYSIDDPERLRGTPVSPDAAETATPIPGARAEGQVLDARADALTGLSGAGGAEVQEYRPRLSLDYVGQPYVGGGADQFGGYLGGGASLYFSDMLGHHTLGTALQVQGGSDFSEVSGFVSYVNRARRLNWGATLARIPYVTGGYAAGLDELDGRPVYVEQTLVERQSENRAALEALYPLSRADRFELTLGFRNISFDSQLLTDVFDLETGEYLGRQEQELPRPAALNLGQAGAGFVRDTSVFGATSPVLGQRFRAEAVANLGSLDYTGVLLDARQYVMPVRPLTVAARLLHYGRYGSGGEDPLLSPLYVGYPTLVRGWDVDSFSAAECPASSDGSCPVFDQLLGSRMLVANLELRAPLLGLFGARSLYGPVPIEVGAFFDTGVAWFAGQKPEGLGGQRGWVRSVGGTARLNLFGALILQVDLAFPLERPGRGSFWQFNLIPGF